MTNKTINKEEDVKLTELTKDQLKDLEIVKAMIKEAVDKAIEDTTKELTDKASKDCEQKMKDMAEAAIKDAEDKKKKKEEEEEEDKKKKKASQPGAEENSSTEETEEDKKKKKKEAEEEEEEDAKKKKKAAPSENKGSGKTGGVKHGAGNQSPTGEDPGDALDLTKKVEELEKQNKDMLDENVKINAELHKMVAERLYDLKKNLRKPDVVSISTPDARTKKVEEFAQRSIDSLKDQINDLIVEQQTAPTTGSNGNGVESPAISASDMTNEVIEDKKKVKLGKQETLTRLFPKSK
jgi:DNA mismatch repair ATPase MutL